MCSSFCEGGWFCTSNAVEGSWVYYNDSTSRAVALRNDNTDGRSLEDKQGSIGLPTTEYPQSLTRALHGDVKSRQCQTRWALLHLMGFVYIVNNATATRVVRNLYCTQGYAHK